jgi:hypothetical protein
VVCQTNETLGREVALLKRKQLVPEYQ